jgi:hypothetical protein
LITAVAFDAETVEPPPFVAVTRTRSRVPTSSPCSVYDDPFALGITAQFEPSGLPPSVPQRTHWNVKVIGVGPFHFPVEALSVEPCVVEPEIDGSLLFVGAFAFALATGAVAFEATVFEPTLFDACTRSRSRFPTSSFWRTYADLVAPEILAQLLPSDAPPLLGHLTHWSAKEIGSVPVHVPLVPVRV